MQFKYFNLYNLLTNNKLIVENYFFITILKILNSLFYLIIYPFIINKLGAESYGVYVFATSVVGFFSIFINFGFDMHGSKLIAQNQNDNISKINTLSSIFFAKFYLLILSFFVFVIIVLSVNILRGYWIIYILSFSQNASFILFPQWYFQGIQKMRVVTYIQFGIKVLTIPFILFLIGDPSDLWIYVLIVSLGNIIGSIIASLMIRYKDGLIIKFIRFRQLKQWYKEAFPFFLNSAIGAVKEQFIVIITGSFFGMRDVAIYDLGYKIMSLPRLLLLGINDSIFPKIVNISNKKIIKTILRIEALIGLVVVVAIVVFGKWMVIILGGQEMIDAYPIAIILSILVFTWLIVGAYIYFIFIPNNKYFLVTKKQVVSFVSFFFYCFIGLLFYQNIYVLAIALSLSGLTEVFYCMYITRINKLL
jgi:PST family polysaccharide transporter